MKEDLNQSTDDARRQDEREKPRLVLGRPENFTEAGIREFAKRMAEALLGKRPGDDDANRAGNVDGGSGDRTAGETEGTGERKSP